MLPDRDAWIKLGTICVSQGFKFLRSGLGDLIVSQGLQLSLTKPQPRIRLEQPSSFTQSWWANGGQSVGGKCLAGDYASVIGGKSRGALENKAPGAFAATYN